MLYKQEYEQIHCVKDFIVYTFSTSEIVGIFKSLKGNGKGKISYTLHILAKLLIYKCSVCVAMECAVIVFLTQTDDISLTYQGSPPVII